MFNNNLCELNQFHRFNKCNVLQYAYRCANGERIGFDNYTKEEHELCSSWTNQAVDALNNKFNVRYAKGKQIEVAGAKQSKFLLHNRLKVMAYKSNKLVHNSEHVVIKHNI